jgi:hypothetical protein
LTLISRKNWRSYTLVAVAFLIVAAIFFLPVLVPAGWHLVHGDFARFQLWEVPVPKGWWAFTRKGTLIVQKMEKFSNRDSQVIINDLPVSTGSYDYEKEKNSLVQHYSKQGYRFLGERQTRVDGKECFCLSFLDPNDRENIKISCDVPRYRLLIYFEGNSNFAVVFDAIIQEIRRVH